MTIITQTTKTSTGFIGLWQRIAVVTNNPDFAAVALFVSLGLLASIYLMTHFPFSVEDATVLASWL